MDRPVFVNTVQILKAYLNLSTIRQFAVYCVAVAERTGLNYRFGGKILLFNHCMPTKMPNKQLFAATAVKNMRFILKS